MTARQFLAEVLSLATPTVVALIGYAFVRLTEVIHNAIRDRRVANLMTLLADGAATAVANQYQTHVSALKSPDKPGVWTREAGARAKEQALSDVRAVMPRVLRELQRNGIANVDRLLDQLVEASVLKLKGTVEPVPLLELTSAPPPPLVIDGDRATMPTPAETPSALAARKAGQP